MNTDAETVIITENDKHRYRNKPVQWIDADIDEQELIMENLSEKKLKMASKIQEVQMKLNMASAQGKSTVSIESELRDAQRQYQELSVQQTEASHEMMVRLLSKQAVVTEGKTRTTACATATSARPCAPVTMR